MDSMNKSTGASEMPPEIWEQIYSYMDVNSLLNVSMVNKENFQLSCLI
jgi:hypothetical protein